MPHWLAVLLIIAGAIGTLGGAGVVIGKVARSLIGGYNRLLELLEQIRDASSGVQRLAREVESLAGAISNFVVGIHDQVRAHGERLDQLEELKEIVIDLGADFRRHVREHE